MAWPIVVLLLSYTPFNTLSNLLPLYPACACLQAALASCCSIKIFCSTRIAKVSTTCRLEQMQVLQNSVQLVPSYSVAAGIRTCSTTQVEDQDMCIVVVDWVKGRFTVCCETQPLHSLFSDSRISLWKRLSINKIVGRLSRLIQCKIFFSLVSCSVGTADSAIKVR